MFLMNFSQMIGMLGSCTTWDLITSATKQAQMGMILFEV